MDWVLARVSTSTLKLDAAVPPKAVAVTAEVLDDVAVTAFQVVRLLSELAALASVENIDLNSPKAEILVSTVVPASLSLSNGFCSSATSCDTIDLTSSPLPMPTDEMLAMMNS